MHITKTKSHRLGALMLALLLLLPFAAALSLRADAKSSISYIPSSVKDKTVGAYEEIKVTAKDGSTLKGRLINGTTFVPLRAFYDAHADATISYHAATRTATVTADGLSLTATDGARYLIANGRYLYTDTPLVILSDGSFYAPIRLLAKTLSLTVGWDNATRSASLTGKVTPLEHGSTYYDADDLYWLSRIISAESRGEPLIGQIAVGNVVQNRVASNQFPNTVYGVIFDFKHGTQFTPAATGAIYKSPYYLSVIAAKICLEGYTVSDAILFFYEPTASTTNWIDRARPFAFRIGAHRFYY
ncbi:MAG: cell wall hydrolase [Clostridia bacterium]|nr:cell wall hydrolase [Clostridia bacterium]